MLEEEKIKVAVIYKKDNLYLSGKCYDNTYYHFFIKALPRNKRLSITFFPTEEIFDAKILKNKFDIILLWSNSSYGMPKEILGINDLDIPVIARCSDPGDAKKSIKNHKEWKINFYFDFYSEEFFHELYPKKFKYKTIFYTLESSLFQKVNPFSPRIKTSILNSGNVGNTKFISKIINDIRNPKWNSYRCKVLRTKCNELPYVDYSSTLDHKFVNDNYSELLQKYQAAIAADTYTPVQKYWEIPAAGCVTFMEMTKKNKGEYLGFVDNESAIFIDEDNYTEKFREYLKSSDDEKWRKIAENGRKYALEKFSNDKGVESLIQIMEELIH